MQVKWTVRWIEIWLNSRVQRVEISAVECSWRSVVSGFLQRSILGTVLFNLFISDLGEGLECTLSMSANDMELGEWLIQPEGLCCHSVGP